MKHAYNLLMLGFVVSLAGLTGCSKKPTLEDVKIAVEKTYSEIGDVGECTLSHNVNEPMTLKTENGKKVYKIIADVRLKLSESKLKALYTNNPNHFWEWNSVFYHAAGGENMAANGDAEAQVAIKEWPKQSLTFTVAIDFSNDGNGWKSSYIGLMFISR